MCAFPRKKNLWLIASLFTIIALLFFLFAGCGGTKVSETPETTATGTNGEKAFTVEELSEFDGKGGRQAYVAVDGVVYDITGASQWEDGKHTPCNLDAMAGKDLSGVLKQAPPRMRDYIESEPVVGKIAQ